MTNTAIGSLCTGYGGLDAAVQEVAGGELAWWSDIEPGPIAVMERHHPGVPNLGDLKLVDWSVVDPIQILTAGYPCQPFSNAGKRLGTEDPRHLWPWIKTAIGVLRPRLVVLENVSGHLRRGFDVVSADLAGLGYDAAWAVVPASAVGAPHIRKRLFVVAEDANSAARGERWLAAPGQEEGWRARADAGGRGGVAPADAISDTRGQQPWRISRPSGAGETFPGPDTAASADTWGRFTDAIQRWERVTGRVAPGPLVPGRGDNGVLSPRLVEWMMGLPAGYVTDTEGLSRNDMLKLLGNGVVKQQAAAAIRHLLGVLEASSERAA